jgi:hypothetical protein
LGGVPSGVKKNKNKNKKTIISKSKNLPLVAGQGSITPIDLYCQRLFVE